jgi:hypothetical protein
MAEKWQRARVVAFTEEQGFGRALVDGRELVFDATAVVGRLPQAGEIVKVRAGEGLRGPKIVALRSLEPEVREEAYALPKKAAALLRELGVAPSLDDRALRRVLRELDSFALVDVLCAYYDEEPERAVADGFLTHDWRFGAETDDVIAEFAARVSGEPLLVQIENDPERGVLRARAKDGRDRAFDFGADASLATIAEAFDEELARAKDPRRFFSLETGGDYFAFLLLRPAVASRLLRGRALPSLPPCDHPAFRFAQAAYRSGAYRSSAESFAELAGLGLATRPGDRAWLEVVTRLASALAALAIFQDRARAEQLIGEAAALARDAPDEGLELDTAKLRRQIALAKRGMPKVAPRSPLPARFAPSLALLPMR